MTTIPGFTEAVQNLQQVKLSVQTAGDGQVFLFLHPGEGLIGSAAFLEVLSKRGRVIVPSHPGFGHSELPKVLTTVDDLSYVYLDLLEKLAVSSVVLIGVSFGGWIAAELAVKNTARISRLVLINSLGIKVGDRNTRDILDMHAIGRDALAESLYADPAKHRPDFAASEPGVAEEYARDREAFTYFGWQPYMHNPKLKDLLHRIDVPTLVLWGGADRVVRSDYGRAFADTIPNARFEIVANAGHMAHVEKPSELTERIVDFVFAERRSH